MVYVGNKEYKYRQMLMSHMVADNLIELHAMADKIGVQRKYFQDAKIPHYDICKNKKQLAILNGAKLISDKQIIILCKYHNTSSTNSTS
jgi:hypothetical protein